MEYNKGKLIFFHFFLIFSVESLNLFIFLVMINKFIGSFVLCIINFYMGRVRQTKESFSFNWEEILSDWPVKQVSPDLLMFQC